MIAKILNSFNNFAPKIIRSLVPNFSGMLCVKAGRPLVGWMLKSVLLVRGSIANSSVKVVVSYVRTLYSLRRRSGLVFTVRYLKACTSLLMQAIAGDPHKDPRVFSCAVSRTGRGLPRIIPKLHRSHIIKGSVYHIRLWLTLFSLYRVLDYTGKLSIKTIITPSTYVFDAGEVKNSVAIWMREFHIPPLDITPGNYIVRPFWIPTTSPNSTKSELAPGAPKTCSTSIYTIVGSYYALCTTSTWKLLKEFCHAIGADGTYPYILSGARFASRYLPPALLYKGPGSDHYQNLELRHRFTGRLGYKVEPAGKIRVFAMVDVFTQWIMAPLHKALFSRLQRHPCDATHDQSRTLSEFVTRLRERGIKRVYSFDLTAATDRIPVSFQSVILSALSGSDSLGPAWAACLVDRWYQLPPVTWKGGSRSLSALGFTEKSAQSNPFIQVTEDAKGQRIVGAVRYAVGQPMGALSSWAMLAVSHHIMVAMAAHRVGRMGFRDYIVLGDDLVIADSAVAKSYLKVASDLGVDINLSKSVLSNNGSLEFAKRFIYRYQDVSGLSFKEMAVSRFDIRGLIQLFNRVQSFRKIRVSELLSFLGHGYRSLSRISAKFRTLSGSMQRVLLLVSYPGMLFSNLNSVQAWVLSTAFNKGGLRNMPDQAIEFIKELLRGASDAVSYPTTPRNPEEFDIQWKRLFVAPTHDSPVELTNLERSEFVRSMLADILNPLYMELMVKWGTTVIEVKNACEYEDPNLELTFNDLWSYLVRLEDLASLGAQTREFVSHTDVLTLGKSSLLRRAKVIRSYVHALNVEHIK